AWMPIELHWAMDGPFAATPESVSGRRNPGEAGAGTGARGFAYFAPSKYVAEGRKGDLSHALG
ncbi:hypothetical protein, partial [Pseudomonas viridiflava]|uniref:hypothetical protein n=1 Tax=Pseudomonas viridiflava TaxID=33069 RepID=UPI00197D919E